MSWIAVVTVPSSVRSWALLQPIPRAANAIDGLHVQADRYYVSSEHAPMMFKDYFDCGCVLVVKDESEVSRVHCAYKCECIHCRRYLGREREREKDVRIHSRRFGSFAAPARGPGFGVT